MRPEDTLIDSSNGDATEPATSDSDNGTEPGGLSTDYGKYDTEPNSALPRSRSTTEPGWPPPPEEEASNHASTTSIGDDLLAGFKGRAPNVAWFQAESGGRVAARYDGSALPAKRNDQTVEMGGVVVAQSTPAALPRAAPPQPASIEGGVAIPAAHPEASADTYRVDSRPGRGETTQPRGVPRRPRRSMLAIGVAIVLVGLGSALLILIAFHSLDGPVPKASSTSAAFSMTPVVPSSAASTTAPSITTTATALSAAPPSTAPLAVAPTVPTAPTAPTTPTAKAATPPATRVPTRTVESGRPSARPTPPPPPSPPATEPRPTPTETAPKKDDHVRSI